MSQNGGHARWKEGAGQAVRLGTFFFAIDPVSGHLYPASEAGPIKFRDQGDGTLAPTDATTQTAARMVIRNGSKGLVY